MKRLIAILLLICVQTFAAPYHYKIKIIPLKALDYETVKIFCEPMLSEDGKMVYLKDRRAIFVHDDQKVIDRINKFLADADTKREQIKVTVEFNDNAVIDSKEFGVDSKNWTIKVEDGKVKLPKIDGVNVGKKKGTVTRNTAMSLTTISGGSASLWVGKEVPEINYVELYLARPTTRLRHGGKLLVYADLEFQIRKVGAKLKMRPRLLASGLIEIDLYPEISYISEKGKRGSIEVESLTTTVTVMPNQKVHIGGLVGKKQDEYTSLFGPDFFRSEDSQRILKIFVTASVAK